MPVEYRVFDNAEAYRPFIPEVAQLFSTVFERAFPTNVWSQWYLENPYGSPYVALAYSGDQLVGHHALVPQTLVCQAEDLRYLLAISLMVHPRFRNLVIFQSMADTLHRLAREGEWPFILAFPNDQAAPLWQNLYHYKPLLETQLCNWVPNLSKGLSPAFTGAEGSRNGAKRIAFPGGAYWSWRTRNNHARYCTLGKTLQLVYKVIEPGTLMVLDTLVDGEPHAAECVATLARGLDLREVRLTKYHADRLGVPDAELIPHENYVVRFLGFPLAGEVPDVRFHLLLSDVF